MSSAQRAIHAVITGLIILLGMLHILSYFIKWWPFELVVTTTATLLPALLTLLIAQTLYIVITKKDGVPRLVIGMVAAAFSLIILSFVLSIVLQPPAEPEVQENTNARILRIATFNKLYSNKQYEEIADYFRRIDVDVVTIQEAKIGEIVKITQLMDYPYHYETTVTDPRYGRIGVISKHPLKKTETRRFGNYYSYVRAEFTPDDKTPYVLYSTHVTPPESFATYQARNQHMQQLATEVSDESQPVIVAGDFNTTVFSPVMRSFNTSISSATNVTTQKPWPECSFHGFPKPVCLRIDHLFVPEASTLHSVKIAPDLGSDHRSVVAEFSL